MPLRLLSCFRPQRRLFSVWLLGVSALLGSCRSGQVAFQFRPATGAGQPTAAVNWPTPASDPALSTKPEAALPQPEVAYVPAAALKSTPKQEAKTQAPASAKPVSLGRVVAYRPLLRQQSWRPKPETTGQPHTTTLRETAHLVLGIALVAAGIVAGVLLGGWLGLGVGAAVVIAGYYFLGLAFGGKHAWLEVFQEFFNM